MADVVIIDRVEDDAYDGKAFKKVTDKTGKTFNVKYGREGKLKAKWDLLIPGNAIEITWGEYNGKPFVQDFKVVAEAGAVAELEPQPSDQVLPEHKKVIAEAFSEPKEDNLPRTSFPPVGTGPVVAPQAIGMMTKEIGDMIRAKMLTTLFGATIKEELVAWYRSQVFGITRITYDGKDLPE